jgi:hypothetical protein
MMCAYLGYMLSAVPPPDVFRGALPPDKYVHIPSYHCLLPGIARYTHIQTVNLSYNFTST